MDKTDSIKSMLKRGLSEIIHLKALEKKLKAPQKLRIKLGFDPTRPDSYIGNAVALLKVRALQDLGHKAVIIVGDYTGMIGDTSIKKLKDQCFPRKILKKY